MIATPALPSIVEVAQPELKLAGLRINPRTYSPSRFSFGTDLALLDVHTQAEMKVTGLPKPLRLADSAWSPDQRYLAFTHVAYSDKARRLGGRTVAGRRRHARGEKADHPADVVRRRGRLHLAARLQRPAGQPEAGGPRQGAAGDRHPERPEHPGQPARGARQLRTYPDLLKNEEDAKLFEHYATVQLALVDLAGKTRMVGAPDLFIGARLAPGGKYILTQALQRPFSYVVPASAFARRIDVRDLSGKAVHLVANKPLEEGLPPGNDAVSAGVRDVSWRVDAPATLVWAEAQDGGDPAKAGRGARHRLRAGRAVRAQAGGAGEAGLALQRHPVGPRRPGAAVGRLVQDARAQDLAHRAGPAGRRAGTGVRVFRRRPLQQSRPAR